MYNSLIIFIMMLMCLMFTISSDSFSQWMILELNTFFFFIYMMNINLNNSFKTIMNYFLIQSLATVLLILSIFGPFDNPLMMSLFTTTILLKMGMVPFHWWLPPLMKNLDWQSLFILTTLQKFIPMVFLSNKMMYHLLTMIIMLNILYALLMMINTWNTKFLFIYSSMIHTSWLIITFTLSTYLFLFYFIIYTLMNMIICWLLDKFENFMYNKFMNLLFFFIIMSMLGLPPFLGFSLKLIPMMFFTMNNMTITMILLMIMTTFTFILYFKMIYLMIFKSIKYKTIFEISHYPMIQMFLATIISFNLIMALMMLF